MIKVMKIQPNLYHVKRRIAELSFDSTDILVGGVVDAFNTGQFYTVVEYDFEMSLEQVFDHAYLEDEISIGVGDIVYLEKDNKYHICLPYGWKSMTKEEILTF